MNLHARSRARAPSTGPCRCRKSLPIRLRRPVICCFPETDSSNINNLALIPFFPRARRTRALRRGKLRQPAGPAARHPQPQAARPRSCRPAAERAGAVGSARSQATSVAAARRAAVAAAARCDRPGGASSDRPGVVAHGRRFPAGAVHRSDGRCARRDRACRGRAHRTAGTHRVARAPAPRTVEARSTHPTRRAD
jgi:hypothetical protein